MINVLSVIACISTMTASVVCAFGKLKAVYIFGIFNGVIFVFLNGAIAFASSGQRGVSLMIVPSAWMVCTGCFGLWRLRRQERKSAGG